MTISRIIWFTCNARAPVEEIKKCKWKTITKHNNGLTSCYWRTNENTVNRNRRKNRRKKIDWTLFWAKEQQRNKIQVHLLIFSNRISVVNGKLMGLTQTHSVKDKVRLWLEYVNGEKYLIVVVRRPEIEMYHICTQNEVGTAQNPPLNLNDVIWLRNLDGFSLIIFKSQSYTDLHPISFRPKRKYNMFNLNSQLGV